MFVIHIKISGLLEPIRSVIGILVIRTASRRWFNGVNKINKFAIIRVYVIWFTLWTTTSCLDVATLF
jgi:hypothetical protein